MNIYKNEVKGMCNGASSGFVTNQNYCLVSLQWPEPNGPHSSLEEDVKSTDWNGEMVQ